MTMQELFQYTDEMIGEYQWLFVLTNILRVLEFLAILSIPVLLCVLIHRLKK